MELPKQGYTEFFSWGNDNFGQLGHGTSDKQSQNKRRLNLPKSLSFDVIITDIGCGANHASFLTASGQVFGYGDNTHGQLGVNDRKVKFAQAPLLVQSLKS